jgi:hypothetical protein
MADLQMNGNFENYLAQLFNPQAGGGQGMFGAAGIGGQMSNPGSQIPQALQGLLSQSTSWPQQQQNPGHSQIQAQALAAVQLAQQIVAKQAVQAIQCVQALQTLQQHVQQSAWQQGQFGAFGQPGQVGAFGQSGQGFGQFNSWGGQNPNQAQQQQALQQLAQSLAAQQQPQQQPGQFRYG